MLAQLGRNMPMLELCCSMSRESFSASSTVCRDSWPYCSLISSEMRANSFSKNLSVSDRPAVKVPASSRIAINPRKMVSTSTARKRKNLSRRGIPSSPACWNL